jgi:hypothetical protein
MRLDTNAVNKEKGVELLGVVIISGEIVEFSEKQPGRIHWGIVSFLLRAFITSSLMSDGNCSFCHFRSTAMDLSALCTAFKAYNAATKEWSAI